jgi:hypothetical protein
VWPNCLLMRWLSTNQPTQVWYYSSSERNESFVNRSQDLVSKAMVEWPQKYFGDQCGCPSH